MKRYWPILSKMNSCQTEIVYDLNDVGRMGRVGSRTVGAWVDLAIEGYLQVVGTNGLFGLVGSSAHVYLSLVDYVGRSSALWLAGVALSCQCRLIYVY
jgi:hypothetical protein